MATIPYTIVPALDAAGAAMAGVFTVTWTGLANGDQGKWLRMPNYSDRSIQVWGQAGGTPTWNIEGSNEQTAAGTDPADPAFLTNPGGTTLSVRTTEEIQQILQNTQWIRPTLTVGAGTCNFTLLVNSMARRS